MTDPCWAIDMAKRLTLIRQTTLLNLLEQMLMISWFDPQKEVTVGFFQVADMRGVAAEGVLGNDDRQMGMFPKVLEPTVGGIAFTVVFFLAVLPHNGFGSQGNDFGKIRVDHHGGQHLVVVG